MFTVNPKISRCETETAQSISKFFILISSFLVTDDENCIFHTIRSRDLVVVKSSISKCYEQITRLLKCCLRVSICALNLTKMRNKLTISNDLGKNSVPIFSSQSFCTPERSSLIEYNATECSCQKPTAKYFDGLPRSIK